MKGKIITLSIGKPKVYQWKRKPEPSGIAKANVHEVHLNKQSFEGDGVANEKFHGGPDRAVCAYPFEHYEYWEKVFQRPFAPPSFGENICVKDMMEKDVYIGDIFQTGNVIIQITQGRIPCSTLSKFNETDALLSKTFETGYTGYFFKVLEEGKVYSESSLDLIERRQESISVLDANLIMFRRNDAQKIKELLALKDLADEWKRKLEKYLAAVK
ncbi:MOSC domain-containing protein [Cytobacillus gottheilii]|uniref:MOSC domain-containing protein n=1 Tax=Cytobacillus gottheilii TaxID=859144 RepID=UPI0021493B33|nr:MOSC domain-containing protein [Cytobacillus gottheilii]